jgi:hypothetical protein
VAQLGFQKGNPKPANSGRKKGTPNKRTIYVREVLEAAAAQIGGVRRLTEWIKEAPENEFAFWSSMYMKLLPVHLQGSGEDGEVVVRNLSMDELRRELQERGLPTSVFGVDVPVLELEAEKVSGDGS